MIPRGDTFVNNLQMSTYGNQKCGKTVAAMIAVASSSLAGQKNGDDVVSAALMRVQSSDQEMSLILN